MEVYDGIAGSCLLALEIVLLCWIIYSAYYLFADSVILSRSQDFKVLRDMQARVVQSHSNVIEIVNLVFQLTAFIIWWMYQLFHAYRFAPSRRYDIYNSVSEPSAHYTMPFKNQEGNDLFGGTFVNGTVYKVPQRPQYAWELPEDDSGYVSLIKMYENIDAMRILSVAYNLITGINLLIMFVRFLLLLKFQPRLAIITRTLERASVDVFHFLFMYFVLMIMASVLGNTMFGHSIECVSSIPSAFELLFLLLIGATSFTEFVPEGFAANKLDKFFQIFYCGLIPIVFQWILFEFFLAILANAFGEEKEILHDIELGGDTLPNDLRKFAEYKMATIRREWPKFEDVYDLLKEGIQLHEKQHPIKEEKDQRKRLVETDDIKEDDNELNYMVITSVAKKFSVDPHADLLNSDKSYISNILQNRPNIEDNHEELNEKREKVQTMKINMYRRLKIYVDEAKDDMEIHLRHQRKLAEHSAKAAARWKRIKLLAEDIEIALQDVTKETFDKQNIKAKVRELQAKRREAENAYEKKWKEAIEKVKRYRSAPPKSVFDATSVLLKSKSKSLKIQQALKLQKLYSQHGTKSSNRRHREKQIEESRNIEAELSALRAATS